MPRGKERREEERRSMAKSLTDGQQLQVRTETGQMDEGLVDAFVEFSTTTPSFQAALTPRSQSVAVVCDYLERAC